MVLFNSQSLNFREQIEIKREKEDEREIETEIEGKMKEPQMNRNTLPIAAKRKRVWRGMRAFLTNEIGHLPWTQT